MINITARQIGGLICILSDFVCDLQNKNNVSGLTVIEDIRLRKAHSLLKEIYEAQPKKIDVYTLVNNSYNIISELEDEKNEIQIRR